MWRRTCVVMESDETFSDLFLVVTYDSELMVNSWARNTMGIKKGVILFKKEVPYNTLQDKLNSSS